MVASVNRIDAQEYFLAGGEKAQWAGGQEKSKVKRGERGPVFLIDKIFCLDNQHFLH
jgi:hypothetical protein